MWSCSYWSLNCPLCAVTPYPVKWRRDKRSPRRSCVHGECGGENRVTEQTILTATGKRSCKNITNLSTHTHTHKIKLDFTSKLCLSGGKVSNHLRIKISKDTALNADCELGGGMYNDWQTFDQKNKN